MTRASLYAGRGTVMLAMLLILAGCGRNAALLNPAGGVGTAGTAASTVEAAPAESANQPKALTLGTGRPAATSVPEPDVQISPTEPARPEIEGVAVTPALPTPATDAAQVQGPPPPAPSLGLRRSSDTGASDSDLLTGNNTPTFEGDAQPGATVGVYDGAALLGTARADQTGYWAYMVGLGAGLDDGVHAITAVAVDGTGRTSLASAVLRVTIDTEPAAAPVITAAAVQGRNVTLAGTAPLSTTVTVLEARAPLTSVPVEASGHWSITLGDVLPGIHHYRAGTTSAAGVASPANDTKPVTVEGGPAPTATASPASTRTIVAVAGGDIACDRADSGGCQQKATSDIAINLNPDIVLALGDNQYDCGSLADFNSYYGPSWGRLLDRTHPTPGNHEYKTGRAPGDPCYNAPAGAPGYFRYFGAAASPGEPGCTAHCKGYYSYDAGGWHMVVLNSVCAEAGGCGLGSPQETWLRQDLAAHPTACTLAYWHYPRFSSGETGKTFLNGLKAFWQDLYNAGVAIVLNGHDHDYERFSRLDANGNPDAAHGIREFVVGTGGQSHDDFAAATAPGSQVRNNTAFGVLELRLAPGSYSWQFAPVAGLSFTDTGSEACRSW